MLLTKFFLPELRPMRVPRPRLLARLKQSAHSSLIIVSAPAGFGKTSLVSEWVRAEGLRVAWVSLDESDNDPTRFWMAVANALETLFPGAGKNSQDLLSARQPPAPQVLLTTLLNDLTLEVDRVSQAASASLVLDDLHLLTNPAIYENLLFFVERLPHPLHLVLIGRSDPPLPLGRLRASGRLLEVRAADLRFTLDESLDFLNRVMGLPLTPRQVQQLDERTEGWIAGLQLAGLALQGLAREAGGGDIPEFIESFSGNDRYILEYLVEEVLNRLPDTTRTFLLQTSILQRMCAPLCEAVTGLQDGNGQQMLERLERQNLFLIPMDNRRVWYRYHHLFADLLRRQLERQGEGMVAELHNRAAAWLAGQGLLSEAIHHALQGQDFTHTAEWIEMYGWQAIGRGEYATLKHWVETLPEAIAYTRPELLLQFAWALAYLGEIDRYEQPLAAAERLWREQGNQAGLGEVLNLRADFAATFGDGERAAELARQALDLLPEENDYHRGMSWVYIGAGSLLQGGLEAAHAAFTQGKALCEQSGNNTGARLATLNLAQIAQLQANLPEAVRLLEEVHAQTGNLPVYEGLVARLLLGSIWREWNRLDEAETMLRRVLESVEQTGQVIYLHTTYLHLALVLWTKGEIAEMEQVLDQHARLAEQIGDPRLLDMSTALRLQLALLSRDVQAVQHWNEELRWDRDEPVRLDNEVFHMALARFLSHQGEAAARKALLLLNELQILAEAQQRTGSLVEIWLLKALTLWQLQETNGAGSALERSLALAQPGGYLRVFIDEGQSFFSLLAWWARTPSLSTDLRSYVLQLQRFAPGIALAPENQDRRSRVPDASESLIEPLTPREIEVLHLIQAGFSNQLIAEKLYLTLNTVKVHVKNIFAKLNVSSRTQAVRRAQELGLI